MFFFLFFSTSYNFKSLSENIFVEKFSSNVLKIFLKIWYKKSLKNVLCHGISTNIYIYIYIYMWVYVCVCVHIYQKVSKVNLISHLLHTEFFLLPVWHLCRMVNAQWPTWGWKATDFSWATLGWPCLGGQATLLTALTPLYCTGSCCLV